MPRLLGALSVVALVGVAVPGQAKVVARLCVDRPEQGGNRNAIPVSVTVQSKQVHGQARLEFVGGGIRKCSVVPLGEDSVVLRFHYPSLVSTKYWQEKTSIRMHRGDNLFTLDVRKNRLGEEIWSEAHWHSMWDLKRRR